MVVLEGFIGLGVVALAAGNHNDVGNVFTSEVGQPLEVGYVATTNPTQIEVHTLSMISTTQPAQKNNQLKVLGKPQYKQYIQELNR